MLSRIENIKPAIFIKKIIVFNESFMLIGNKNIINLGYHMA